MVAVKEKFVHLQDGTVDIASWLQKIKTLNQLKDVSLLEKAFYLASSACSGLTTFYGQPCIEQGLEIAEILLNLKLDQETATAGIIISALNHTSIKEDILQKELGENITKLLAGVAKMNFINNLAKTRERDHVQIDRLRKTLLAMVSDIRVVLIKLAERCCLMRSIKHINHDERKRLAQETMDIYAPLANRLGIGQLKWELEDFAFHYINPDAYKTIAAFLAERRVDREQLIHEIIATLKTEFVKCKINAELTGRAKHIYSIYLKQLRKHLDYKHIYDYSAVRILVPTLADCYTALSIIHHLWEHIPEEFDDYISNPKSNGYRSIHTAVIGPNQKNMEIQIRTFEMHEEAEHGVAAHWIYKEKKPQAGYESRITYLRQLLAWQKDVAKEDSITREEQETLDDRVYIFTPEGDILDLPIGATPLDFAYQVHTELGHRCRGAKINGHIVQLTYQLKTGDQVDIITTKEGAPSRDWLNKESGYITTARARAKINQWFRHQEITQYIEEGKHHLERELTRAGIHQPNIQKIASHFHYKDDNSFYAAIGYGTVRLSQIIAIAHTQTSSPETTTSYIPPLKKITSTPKSSAISGADKLLTRIAKCCKPIPYDDIIGYITQGRGVSIHQKKCNNLKQLSKTQAGRYLEISWDENQGGSYYVDLQIRSRGKESVLKDITGVLTHLKLDLVSLNSSLSKKTNMIYITLTLLINDTKQLTHVCSALQQLPHIIDVRRVKH